MNMRKIIAVLAAVLMLCAIVPMGAMSVSAAPGDVVVNKNFDDGSVFSNASAENGYMVFDATIDDWYNVYMYANNIKSGTKYEITFDCKANKATNINVKINNNWAHDTFKWTTNVTTEWATYTCVINPDELKPLTSTALLMFTSNANKADGAIYHIDNVVVKEYAEPVAPGSNLFVNGDFEKGSLSGWNKHQQTVVSTDAAKDGSYGAYLNGNSAGWGGVLDQNVNVEDGKTYIFSFDYKAVRQGFNWTLSGVQSGTTYASGYESATSWTHFEKEINVVGDTQLKLNFNCGGQTGTDEMYVDNVSLKEVKDPSFDGYIYNGDFETGKTAPWDIYSSTTVSAEAAKGGEYGMILSGGANWGGMANQSFTVEPGKTYVIRFDLKVVNQGVNVQIKDNGSNVGGGYINKTEWTTYAYDFTPNSANANLNFCGSGTAGGDVVYLDNVMVYEKVEQSNDGYIVNGTFDTGVLTPWNNLWGSCPTAEVVVGGKDSTFALHVVSGQWKHVRQMPVAVEPNTDYKITVWAKNSSNMSLLVKGLQDDKSTETSDIKNVGLSAGDEWTQFTNEFNSGDHNYVIVSFMGGAAEGAEGYFDSVVMEKLHTCNVVEQERVEADCENAGYIKYACDCGLGEYTETIPAKGHAYAESARVDATCGADGSVTYTCGTCGGSYTEAIPATGEHVYFDDCSAICEACGYEREVSHNIVHVEAVAPTCNAMGNIEFWYCDVCGMAWLDEACTMNTNMMAVKLPMAEDHTYTNDFDIDCNVCGAERAVVAPVIEVKLSISEDVNGLAFRFEANVAGFAIKAGTFVQADYTNATYNGYKLIETGAIASNGVTETTIKGERMCDLDENGKALFAYRIINIPADKLDVEITMQPYYIVEIDGEIVTIYGEVQIGAYAEVAIG